MAELTPPHRNVSLDDLLEANKARFDRIFEVQMRESARLDTDRLPPANGDLEASPEPSGGSGGENGGGRAAPPLGLEPPPLDPGARPGGIARPASPSARPGYPRPAAGRAGEIVSAPHPLARRQKPGTARTPAASLDPVTPRSRRERAAQRAPRDGRGALPLRDVPGDPRAARRVPDDHRPSRPDDRRAVRLLRPRDARGAGVRAGARRRHPPERPLQVRRRHQPHQRLDGADPDLLRGRAGRLQLHVRPHDGRRRPGAGEHADRRDLHLRRGDPHPPDQDLVAGQAQRGGAGDPDGTTPAPRR